MPDTDTEIDSQVSDATIAPASASESVPLKRFTGLQSKYDTDKATWEARLRTLQAEYDKRVSDHESEASELRRKANNAPAELQRLQQERDDAIKLADTFKSEVAKTAAEKATRKLLTDKYAGLLADFDLGYLKVRSEFETDEAFDKYLEYQHGRTATTKTNTQADVTGAVPSGGGRMRDDKTKRTAEEIMTEITSIDTRVAGNEQKRAELYVELNSALS